MPSFSLHFCICQTSVWLRQKTKKHQLWTQYSVVDTYNVRIDAQSFRWAFSFLVIIRLFRILDKVFQKYVPDCSKQSPPSPSIAATETFLRSLLTASETDSEKQHSFGQLEWFESCFSSSPFIYSRLFKLSFSEDFFLKSLILLISSWRTSNA